MLRTVTSAPAIPPPDWSSTSPTMVAFVVWAKAPEVSADRAQTSTREPLKTRDMVLPPVLKTSSVPRFERISRLTVFLSGLEGLYHNQELGDKGFFPVLYR